MTDWAIWPIFTGQFIAIILLFFPRHWRMAGLSMRTWVIGLLLLLAIAIVVSLYHDSTDILPLHF